MGTDLETILTDVQETIDKVLLWGSKEKLTFNAAKTAVLVFSRKPGFHAKELPTAKKLKMNDTFLPFSDETIYLGITIDQCLSWDKHITRKISSCKKTLMTKNLINTNWGLNPERLWWIWESVVRPKLAYGANAWINSINVKKNRDSLERLQKLALRLCSSAMPQTSNKGLEVILQTEPLHLFLEGVAIKTRIRTKSQVPLTWDGDSTYHYRRSSQERQCKKKESHLKSLDKKIEEIFPNTLILDKTRKK